jgi:hypothetical protein
MRLPELMSFNPVNRPNRSGLILLCLAGGLYLCRRRVGRWLGQSPAQTPNHLTG